MACEDYPCCGHELGCCPDYDEFGHQMNKRCTCGARIPITARFSLCESCMFDGDDDDFYPGEEMPSYRSALPHDFECGDCNHSEKCGFDLDRCVYDKKLNDNLPDYGASEDWEVAYWRERALRAEELNKRGNR